MATRTADTKPEFGGPYEAWLASEWGVQVSKHKNHYATVVREMREAFETSPFWLNLSARMEAVAANYQISNKHRLSIKSPIISPKSWTSFLEKTYRVNVLKNENFPNPPSQGWVVPPDWHSKVKDIIRTTIAVDYLDGVPLVSDALCALAKEYSWPFNVENKAIRDGYYGIHFLGVPKYNISDIEYEQKNMDCYIEIQVTTNIKEAFKEAVLHSGYEKNRMLVSEKSSDDISWNLESEDFASTYLGHMIHYAEKMMIDLRNKRRSGDA